MQVNQYRADIPWQKLPRCQAQIAQDTAKFRRPPERGACGMPARYSVNGTPMCHRHAAIACLDGALAGQPAVAPDALDDGLGPSRARFTVQKGG
jgi:hypothetical protein